MKKFPDEKRACTWVPLFDRRLHLVVTDDIKVSRDAWSKRLGYADDGTAEGCRGLLVPGKCGRVLFLCRKDICHALIAHEIFHATHRTCEASAVRFGSDFAETHAHVCEWITQWVYATLGRMGEKVRLKMPR